MYTKGQIDRFGKQISDAEQRRIFKEQVAKITFNKESLCSAGELEHVLEGTKAEVLADELGSRIVEFVEPGEIALLESA